VAAREGNVAGSSSVTFTLFLSRPVPTPVSVHVATRDGTAVAGSDYQAFAGVVTFPANAQFAYVGVLIISDAVEEANETFFLDLSNPSSGAVIARSSGQATILDDDGPASLGGSVYSDANFNGRRDTGEAGIANVSIQLFRAGSLLRTLVATTTTNADGQYLFRNLTPGTYSIAEQQPSGFSDGGEQLGSLGGTVQNDAFADINLTGGVDATDYNFGEHPIVKILNLPALFPNRAVTSPVAEGSEAILTGMVFDPNPNDRFILDIDWGDGTPVETHHYGPGQKGDLVSIPHRYLNNGVYTIHLAWRDQDGAGNSGDLQVVVNNVPPSLRPLSDRTLGAGEALHEPVVFQDPGNDTWTAAVDYGDGTVERRTDVRAGQPFHLDHGYAAPGTYRVTVAVIDSDGDIGSQSFLVTVPAAPAATDRPLAEFRVTASTLIFAQDDFAVLRMSGTAPELGNCTCYGEIDFVPGAAEGTLEGTGVATFTAANGDLLVGVIAAQLDTEDSTLTVEVHWRDAVTFSDGMTVESTGRFADHRPAGIIAILIG
jgi:hypothetical protein